ncbi:hypothetical protein BC940DRAFT_371873 [Gongronella butleri]|nr:hypothetical protein BC940DRAFT_371873 [Gongronella butleri]
MLSFTLTEEAIAKLKCEIAACGYKGVLLKDLLKYLQVILYPDVFSVCVGKDILDETWEKLKAADPKMIVVANDLTNIENHIEDERPLFNVPIMDIAFAHYVEIVDARQLSFLALYQKCGPNVRIVASKAAQTHEMFAGVPDIRSIEEEIVRIGAFNVLYEVMMAGPDGISQRGLIKKIGSCQSSVNKLVRKFRSENAMTNVRLGIMCWCIHARYMSKTRVTKALCALESLGHPLPEAKVIDERQTGTTSMPLSFIVNSSTDNSEKHNDVKKEKMIEDLPLAVESSPTVMPGPLLDDSMCHSPAASSVMSLSSDSSFPSLDDDDDHLDEISSGTALPPTPTRNYVSVQELLSMRHRQLSRERAENTQRLHDASQMSRNRHHHRHTSESPEPPLRHTSSQNDQNNELSWHIPESPTLLKRKHHQFDLEHMGTDPLRHSTSQTPRTSRPKHHHHHQHHARCSSRQSRQDNNGCLVQ